MRLIKYFIKAQFWVLELELNLIQNIKYVFKVYICK